MSPRTRRRVKRALDVAGAATALGLAWPAMAAAALAIRATMGAPVLFRHRRPGLGGAPFTLYKLRTMTEGFAADGSPLPDAQRLTRLGHALRAASLDELPQLFNVLRGDMSLVGPRPLLTEYLPRYSPRQARRHEVRPGITGLAQVRGRNLLAWDEKLELDVQYVEGWSLGLDARILAATVLQVLRGRGIAAQGHATMPEFRGSAAAERS
jgi:lipopolysaccharide/colanic/teichoic acid biosynthesis glycosyltransferase